MNGTAFFLLLYAIPLLIFTFVYLFFTLCFYTIAKKTGHNHPWWAFVPVLNVFQMLQVARKPWYWFFLFLIPIVNLVAIALVWIEIAKAREKSPVWGVFMLLPFLNFVALLYLALGSAKETPPHDYHTQNRPRQPVNV